MKTLKNRSPQPRRTLKLSLLICPISRLRVSLALKKKKLAQLPFHSTSLTPRPLLLSVKLLKHFVCNQIDK